MTPPDDKKPPPGSSSRRFPSTPRGVPILPQRAITERGSTRHRDYGTEAGWDDITGKYEGEELKAQRAKRGTDDRIARLEAKHDGLDAKVDRIEISVATINGKMDMIPALITNLTDELKVRREDDRIKLTTTLDVGKHDAIQRIDTQALATRSKWRLVLQIASGVFSAGVLGALIAVATRSC